MYTKAYVVHVDSCKAILSTMQALAKDQGCKEMYKCMNFSCSCQFACMVSHHHWASAQLEADGQLLLPPHWAYLAAVVLHPAVDVVVAAGVAASRTHQKFMLCWSPCWHLGQCMQFEQCIQFGQFMKQAG